MKNFYEEVLDYFPIKISNLIKNDLEFAEEIKLRQAKPVVISTNKDLIIKDYIVCSEDIVETLQKLCEYSVYSYQSQITQGFITIKGGHRVGIVGSCVVEEEKILNIKYVNSLNFRIARQIFGASNNIFNEIYDGQNVFNTIIISPPGYGKTTILKDLIRKLSSIELKLNIGVVDERGELTALYKGVPQNIFGANIDIIENVSKSIGMKILVRSMNPDIIIADEIGTEKDVEAINYAFCSGVKGVFTAHGNNFNDFISNPIMKKIVNLNIIDKLIFLDREKGKIRNIEYLRKNEDRKDVCYKIC